jgi:hypothetical protein
MSAAQQQADRAGRRFDRPDLVALVLGGAGVGYRLVLVLLGVPGTNSDEATFGLAAKHIAEGRELPIYMYGQHYMGALESYLAAPLFAAFGPSWLLLRLPLLALYAVFLLLMYLLTRRLYTPWLAVLTVGFLALGSERVVRDQLTAVGGRPEVKVGVVLLLLIAVATGQRRLRHPWAGYAAFGLVGGVTAWVDWLVLPYLAAAVAVLVVGNGRRLLGWPAGLVLLGFVVGVAPLLVDNLRAPPGQDSVSVFLALNEQGAGATSAAEQVQAGVEAGLPLASGVCPPDGCAPWQSWWGAAYVPLLGAAAALAVVDLRRVPRAGDEPQASRRVRCMAQFALAAAAGLALLAYVRSPASALTPTTSARYLSVLQISLPAALWPLWRVARWLPGGMALRRVAAATATAVLVALSALMLVATADQVEQVPRIRAEERQEADLAAEMRRAGITGAYGTYWTCNRLAFNTREQVACAVVGPALHPGQNRYTPYTYRVYAARRPAFVFAPGEPADTAFARYLRERGIAATVTEAGGYRIYRPAVTVHPWA